MCTASAIVRSLVHYVDLVIMLADPGDISPLGGLEEAGHLHPGGQRAITP